MGLYIYIYIYKTIGYKTIYLQTLYYNYYFELLVLFLIDISHIYIYKKNFIS